MRMTAFSDYTLRVLSYLEVHGEFMLRTGLAVAFERIFSGTVW